MKDTHDMTRLELENEVVELRNIVKGLREIVDKQKFAIDIYCNYIDTIGHIREAEKKRARKKED